MLAGSGQKPGPAYAAGTAEADIARGAGDPAAVPEAASALRAFSVDLYQRLAQQSGNVVFSPYSIAVALAMTRNGARGRTAEQMDAVLHAPPLDRFNSGLNALTRMLAAELRGDGVLVNSVCPGWVATDMGGAGGRPVADGASGIVWAATLPDDGPTGGFFRDGRPIAW